MPSIQISGGSWLQALRMGDIKPLISENSRARARTMGPEPTEVNVKLPGGVGADLLALVVTIKGTGSNWSERKCYWGFGAGG